MGMYCGKLSKSSALTTQSTPKEKIKSQENDTKKKPFLSVPCHEKF